ncbi:glycoside hydrolase [candidate division KSB1 bacterium]|nr:glycoside hydrolase [candidate division KSB1 bacterium]
MKIFHITAVILLCLLCLNCRQNILTWPEESSSTRPWAYWWWMGSAVEEEELVFQLQQMADAGFGGVHIIPIYGTKGYEDQFILFAGHRWMRQLALVTDKARELGMDADMTCGTGWPFGGPHLSENESASRFLIEPFDARPGTIFNRQLKSDGKQLVRVAAVSDTISKNLTDQVRDDGFLTWNVPAGKWRVLAVYSQPTGQQVKRAAPGSEGPVLDHFSAAALKTYLNPLDEAFKNYNGTPVRCFYNDSYEVYGADWTHDFFYQFQHRRGYDLAQQLPALLNEGEKEYIGRVKYDYRKTLDDLLREEFTKNWAKWASAINIKTRSQAHGSPGNLLDLYATVDIPETESFGPALFDIPGLPDVHGYPEKSGHPDPLVFKFASSAAHLSGKQLVSAETGTWAGEHFKVSLAEIKPQVDLLFCGGINHIFYHGVTYSPRNEDWPGWLFYASTNFGPGNPFWQNLPALNKYISRSQAFLQTGQPDNDVLLYFPIHDIWQNPEGLLQPLTVHNTADWLTGTDFYAIAQFLWGNGFTFDYISDRLLESMQYSSAGLVTSDGICYKTIIVPQMIHVPHQTIDKLIRLASAGATVIFHGTLPEKVPGFAGREERQQKLQQSKAGINLIQQSENIYKAETGRGKIWVGDSLDLLLGYADVFGESFAKHHLCFTRRKTKTQSIYFVTNPGPLSFRGWLTLNVPADGGFLFNPLNGSGGTAKWRRDSRGQNQVLLSLDVGESLFILTSPSPVKAEPYKYIQPLEMSYPVEGQWELSYIAGGPECPKDTILSELVSWTDLGDKYQIFSGTARYRTTVIKPTVPCDGWLLHLGGVANSAEIRVNDEKISTIFCHPFVADLGNSLFQNENMLDIYITNLGANRIIDVEKRNPGWKKFYDINFVSIDYFPFDASEWSCQTSGLLGPVTLVPYHK